MTTPTASSAPGWYGDPYVAGTLRYFDGTSWTQHVAPAPQVAPQVAPALGSEPSDPVHWLIPSGRTWQSITAGYVGLFAIVLWPLGPVAVALGVWALKASQKSGSHGRGRAVFAIVVGALASVGLMALFLRAL